MLVSGENILGKSLNMGDMLQRAKATYNSSHFVEKVFYGACYMINGFIF